MPSLRTHLLLLGLVVPALFHLVSASPAQAQAGPRSVSDCERLKNDLAYNQCLATFGPAARNVASGVSAGTASADVASALAAIPQSIAASAAATGAAIASIGRRGRRGRYARHGRQSASFAIAGGESRSYRRHRRRR
ncbi:hypothetical protein [Methylobacterium sp.]|jgi:type IV secretory pathway TrbL component|uniref:hypothetical protein n=1 Tax=Methylobacterium sp. TaxID=409 RepID=UPI0025CC5945|nr:hypothetical protein [Methylobacterium sp.]MBY0260172.1 hypothetical protein [Methylobacterium sp.]